MLVKGDFDHASQLRGFERLDEIPGGSSAGGALQCLVIGVSREIHHGHVALFANGLRGLYAVDLSCEAHVHEDQIGIQAFGLLDGILAAGRHAGNGITELRQCAGQIHGDDAFVLHDQDPRRGVGLGCPQSTHSTPPPAMRGLAGARDIHVPVLGKST